MSGVSHRRPIKVKTISRQFRSLIDAAYGNKFLTSRLSYASITAWILKRTYWTAIYLFGFYFTLQSVIEIFAKYHYNPSYFQITTEQFNLSESVPLPNFTICLPKSYMGLNDEALMTNYLTYKQKIETFFDENTIEGVFNVSTEEIWSDEIYLLVWKYLEMIHEGEWLIESRQNPFANWEHQKNEAWMEALIVFNGKMAALNVTIDQTKSALIGKLISFRSWSQEECEGPSSHYSPFDSSYYSFATTASVVLHKSVPTKLFYTESYIERRFFTLKWAKNFSLV